jgi:hypothetical protein
LAATTIQTIIDDAMTSTARINALFSVPSIVIREAGLSPVR